MAGRRGEVEHDAENKKQNKINNNNNNNKKASRLTMIRMWHVVHAPEAKFTGGGKI